MSLLHIRRENFRKNFGRVKEIVSLPDLIEVQSRSFNNFVQLDFLPDERQKIGLELVLRNVFPIEQGDRFSLNYAGYELGEWSCLCGELSGIEKRYTWKSKGGKKTGVSRLTKAEIDAGARYVRCSSCHSRVSIQMPYSVDEYIHSGKTFAMPLKVRLQLVTWEVDETSGARSIKDIKEQSVFICSLPVMVGLFQDAQGNIKLGDRGIFVINGVHRVVVSQIHRAPGPVFSQIKKVRGGVSFGAKIIPTRGAWLDFEFDNAGALCVRVDKKKKVLATVFLQALGIPKEQILYKFYDVLKVKIHSGNFSVYVSDALIGLRVGTGLLSLAQDLNNKIVLSGKTSEKIELKKGARISQEMVEKFSKLGIEYFPIGAEALVGRSVVKRVDDSTTGEVILQAASVIEVGDLALLRKLKDTSIEVVGGFGVGGTSSLVNTLSMDHINDSSSAAREVYSKIKPGDSQGAKGVEEFVKGMFFNPKYYDLGPVGRVRLNRKLGLNIDSSVSTLTIDDIVASIRYLINLQELGEGSTDDVDDLSNRCVRLVEELLQNQVYLGFSRIEKIAREKLRLVEGNVSFMPYDFINVKPMAAVLGAFFGTGQLSQFMDQTNPLSEMAHKRKFSALGQGGISRERATLDVRDVHPSHYGKICMIETPDGQNIGLISSLAIYSHVNQLGFVETVYKPVKNGVVNQNKAEALDAYQEKGKIIAQAAIKVDAKGKIIGDSVLARKDGDIISVSPDKIDYTDVSTRQLVSVSTALIPFLEHDDASRALMGSNMQRQAVPLIRPSAPLVGTGVERDVASSEGVCILAKNSGYVSYVSGSTIMVSVEKADTDLEEWASSNIDVYDLKKFGRSSHKTCIHFNSLVSKGQYVRKGDLLADGPAVSNGELSLGNNICVAFMPWSGYNFEDAIVVSKRLVSEDLYTSIHIEEFIVEAKDTKLGAEEITRDIPNISERELEILDEDGIVKIGTRVVPGDILVAKATMKGDVQVSPEEKLLRAIFGDKSRDVKDTSTRVPPGINGTVIDVRVFSRSGARKDTRYKQYVLQETEKLESLFKIKLEVLNNSFVSVLDSMLKDKQISVDKKMFNKDSFEETAKKVSAVSAEAKKAVAEVEALFNDRIKVLQAHKKEDISRLRRGDELPSGVLKSVRVFVAMKRPISVGDKMAGRHGNKGVVSKVVDIQDMPYLEDGTPVDIVLNPLGMPGRMNLGQLWETVLGMACGKIGSDLKEKMSEFSLKQTRAYLSEFVGADVINHVEENFGEEGLYDLARDVAKNGLRISTPVFDGADLDTEIIPLLDRVGLPKSGKYDLFDGRTGEKFAQKVTVGIIYMMKLNHMADDKLHARSVGPYSLITQQPLGGKSKGGGQRLGEMEVWALFGYGAAYTLREMLTIKSDDITGRVKAFDAIVHGEEVGDTGLPESFNVLVKELQSLGLSVDLFQSSEERFCE